MMNARVIYNEEFDSFDVEINTGDGWGLETRYPCHTSTKNPMGNANFIHFGIIRKLEILQACGWKITFGGNT